MSSKSSKTKKVLIRHTENVKSKAEPKVLKYVGDNCDSNDQRFVDPSINSTKSILKQMKKVEDMEHKKLTIDDLDENQKVELQKKITAKMNFHIDDQVYKNLVALNISDFEAKSLSRKSMTTPKYVSKVSKDVEPNLQDFYKDAVKLDKPILPPSIKVKHKPIIKYNANDLTDKLLSWDSL